ncbi:MULTISPECIES: hypothetical protein [Streptomyces]|uniref:Uncharacterized protein n=1 Tax=Streptomyces lavendofoliae TaxID=67314 RepID=A0A918I3Y4_9ACTN|nr:MULTISPECIES: hypothetical protein [Streptomyces]GGU62783.1 hypothetical protein GCM10010274_59520 [Streptomyces lavendofoliae]
MAKYYAAFLDGDYEEIAADLVERSGSDYIVYRAGEVAGYIPVANVRSLLREDTRTAR